MPDNTENHTLTLLQQIRNDIKDHREENRDGFKNIALQLAAMTKKLSGQLISEIELREELRQHLERIQRIERRLELVDEQSPDR